MMRPIFNAIAATMLVATSGPAFAASNKDPDWPCIQRKVPELSFGQIWNGPELPASAKDWSKDRQVSDLVEELSARDVITALSDSDPGLLPQADGSGRAQLWPHRHNTDAMSVSLLRRV